jgi:hypothetical protein
MQKTSRQIMALMSPLPTTRLASSVKGFLSETMLRPAKEMVMMKVREPLQEDDTRTEAGPQAELGLGCG